MSRNENSLCSPSAWLSPAEPPSASSPSPLSFGPLTHRHCSMQRRGVCEDTLSWKILNMPGKHTLTAEEQRKVSFTQLLDPSPERDRGQTAVFPWKQSQSLTFLGCRQSCQRRCWSPCCLSSPGSGCRMPGLHLVATGDAGWSDALWETDLCGRSDCQMLTVSPTDRTPILQQLDCCRVDTDRPWPSTVFLNRKAHTF